MTHFFGQNVGSYRLVVFYINPRVTLFMSHIFEQNFGSYRLVVVWFVNSAIPLSKTTPINPIPPFTPFAPITPITLFWREGTWRAQSLLNDDGIFFTAGFSNFSVICCHTSLSRLVIQQVILQTIRETLANKLLSCHTLATVFSIPIMKLLSY